MSTSHAEAVVGLSSAVPYITSFNSEQFPVSRSWQNGQHTCRLKWLTLHVTLQGDCTVEAPRFHYGRQG